MAGVRRLLRRSLLDLWVLSLAVVLCLPAFTHGGLGLAGDLVFSPRQPLTLETLGLGSRAPRAVPLDAVVAALGVVLPGEVLFRVAVVAGALLAGAAAHRLAQRNGCGPLPAAVAATVAVWNPFVVERIALGQWALVLAYGAVGWVVLAVVDRRGSAGGPPWSVWGWVGLASLTPTGGILAVVVAVVLGARDRGRTVLLAAGCAVLQLPWVLPSLLWSGTTRADPRGVGAFGAGHEAPGGVAVSLLGLGGIWDRDSVPSSRTSFLAVLAAVLVVSVLVAARGRLPVEGRRLLALGALGGLLALAPRVPVLDDVVRWTVVHVPGGGLLRDSQKWLVPLVVVVAWASAAAVERAGAWVRRREPGLGVVVGAVAVVLPVLLVPDAGSVTWPTVHPVRYPDDFARVRDHLTHAAQDTAGSGAMVLLPWRAYRAFDWGGARTAHDPAWAWFDVPMVGSSALVVGRVHLDDEDPRASALAGATSGPDAARALARQGIRWVLVYTDDPATPGLDLRGLEEVVPGHDVRLYRVPGAVASVPEVASWRRAVVVGADLFVVVGWVGVCAMALRRRRPDNVRRVRA